MTQGSKPKIIIVVGPTASGKTGLSIEIAKKYGGEVISADSRQIYRELDIGTAKVTAEEMAGVPHHLLDICDVDESYSAMAFKEDCEVLIPDIYNRGHIPIITGGTFFYVDTLIGKVAAAPVVADPELRVALEKKQTEDLYQALQKMDPRRAADVDPDNKRRIIRALEIISSMGVVPPQTLAPSAYDYLLIGLKVDKDTLRERYKTRAETWLTNGFAEEVQHQLDKGILVERMQEIGFEYTLMLEYMNEELTKEQFIEKFIQKNWQYAKRQLTWLKRDTDVAWFEPEENEAIFQHINTFLSALNS